MLKANVGLSRKISRDYNSTGYTVNLEGEIPFPTDDAQGVLEKVRELFGLAQEALAVEIDRDQGEDAIGRRDEHPVDHRPNGNGHNGNGHNGHPGNGNGHSGASKPAPSQAPRPNQPPTNGNGSDDAATNKQVQFLLTMSKRLKLSQPQLENQMNEIIGRRCGVYDLTKKEAGLVLDHFTKAANGASGNGNGRQGR